MHNVSSMCVLCYVLCLICGVKEIKVKLKEREKKKKKKRIKKSALLALPGVCVSFTVRQALLLQFLQE